MLFVCFSCAFHSYEQYLLYRQREGNVMEIAVANSRIARALEHQAMFDRSRLFYQVSSRSLHSSCCFAPVSLLLWCPFPCYFDTRFRAVLMPILLPLFLFCVRSVCWS